MLRMHELTLPDRLFGVSFDVSPGRLTAVLGPNGSGKTSLLRALSGYWAGPVFLGGCPLGDLSAKVRSRLVLYVPSEMVFSFPLIVSEFVFLGAVRKKSADKDLALQALSRVFSPELLNRDVRSLSGGEIQRVIIARAILQDPDIFLFDESLSKQDIHFRFRLGSLFRELTRQGKTVVWVSHDLNQALSDADLFVLLRDGRLVYHGEATTQLASHLEEVFPGAGLRVEWNNDRLKIDRCTENVRDR